MAAEVFIYIHISTHPPDNCIDCHDKRVCRLVRGHRDSVTSAHRQQQCGTYQDGREGEQSATLAGGE